MLVIKVYCYCPRDNWSLGCDSWPHPETYAKANSIQDHASVIAAYGGTL